MSDLSPERVDELAEVLKGHVLGGDTSLQYDVAGQCLCGHKSYEAGGTPAAYLLAHRRLLDLHAEHVAQAVAPMVARWVAEARAEGWDEGWDERDNDCSEPYSPPRRNPYRAALTDCEEQQ